MLPKSVMKGSCESCTFMVDLNFLKHPDDVKKDEFGKSHYSGSHVVSYTAWKSHSSKLQFVKVSGQGAENAFELRRIHCKHPSNPQFQRLLAFVTGVGALFNFYMKVDWLLF